MPAFAFTRQPGALQWFRTGRGGAVLAAEAPLALQALAARVPQPWLWLAPPGEPAALPPDAPPRGLLLRRGEGDALTGPVRCNLSLPLPTETMGMVVVQHVQEAEGGEALLEECARVLQPGGRLCLFALNPFSPYRLRWRKSGLAVRDPAGWQERLREHGLTPLGPASPCGPVWRGAQPARWPAGLRAACLVQAEKRVANLIPPAPARRAWRAAPAS
mgnify:CR=1 FL=1